MIRLHTSFVTRCSRNAALAAAVAAVVLGAWIPATGQEPDRAAQRGQHSKALDRKVKGMAKPPTEAQLGAPRYPGAFYDASNSAGMSLSDRTMYLFMTVDPPAKVAEFYASKLKKQPSEFVKGSFIIALKGKPPFPEKGITIEPNKPGMFDPKYKTVITFASMKAD